MSSDTSTLSSYASVAVSHTLVKASIDWEARVFKGTITFSLSSKDKNLILDTSFLDIKAVKWDSKALDWTVGERKSFLGSPLSVRGVPTQAEGKLSVEFATTAECTGLQWLDPEQTIGKKAPFLFSQCEPIHARSIIPCFDTPSIKSPFSFEIESKYPVLVSGLRVSDSVFEQKVPMPSYLFALAAGNLVGKPIGPRSHVWAEPELVDACQWEFEQDTEKQLAAAESLVFPYEWGTYDVLVLPPSFPFGGMENPNITFATPTLIAGDRTLVNVIAHELAHSWSGNLVSNSNWSHFWLNEGWTVYIERRILGKIHGESYRHFSAIEGWHDLESAVANLPADYTKLRLNLNSTIDPDDTFSTVPYEKGSTFLWYLENLVGRELWDKFIPYYFTKFKYKSLTTEDFKATLYEFFGLAALEKVEWKLWLDTPGLPPKPEFDGTLAEPCYKLAEKWSARENLFDDGWQSWASEKDIAGWNPLQIIVFLNEMFSKLSAVNGESDESKTASSIAAIGRIYNISESNNSEIKFRWLKLAVTARVHEEYAILANWLGTVGRMKFVRPGYLLLKAVDRDLALRTFEEHKNFYHAICRTMVEKDLQK